MSRRNRKRPKKYDSVVPPSSVTSSAPSPEVNPVLSPSAEATEEGRSQRHDSSMKKPMAHLGSPRTEPPFIAAMAGKVLTGPLLKHLYCLLLKLSPSELLQEGRSGNAIALSVSNQWFITTIKCTDIIDLSNLLFEELHQQFEQLLTHICYVFPVVDSSESDHLPPDNTLSLQGFVLLLKCSIIILQFLEFDLALVLEKCQILVGVLRKLCNLNSLRFPYQSTCSLPQACTLTNFSSAILEVFIDEFLVRHELRKHCVMVDCVSATSEKLFLSYCSHDDIHAIMELVSAHFLLSVYDELAFNNFTHSLSWSSEVDSGVPLLSLDAALSLLCHPVIFSAPHLLQAHLILLASRCIDIHMPTDDRKSDMLVMNSYILAFELSVNLYSGYMSTLNGTDNIFGGTGGSTCSSEGLFCSSCIQPMTRTRLYHQVDKLIDFCQLRSHSFLSGSEVDILNNSIAYINKVQHFTDEKFKDKTCTILRYIMLSILSCEEKSMHENGESIQQEIYCIAAVLRLMSASLLQILWLLRQGGCLGGMKNSEQPICKEYDFISGIISCFGNCGKNQFSQSLQRFLFHLMESNKGRHNGTMLMFSHFVGLLEYSFRKKIYFLWNDCIFMLVLLMNLHIFEEGNIDAFGPLQSYLEKTTFPHRSQAKTFEDFVYRRSSTRVALNLKKLQMLHLEDQAKYPRHKDNWLNNEEINDMGTQDGQSNASDTLPTKDIEEDKNCMIEDNIHIAEIFLKWLPGYRNESAEWDDLVDFIDCKPGKDYSGWLKKRERFRKWKDKRMAIMKHKCKNKNLMKEVGGASQSNHSYKGRLRIRKLRF